MAELKGYQTSAPLGGIDNPNLSNGHYKLTSRWYPYSQSLASPMLSGAIVRNSSRKPARVLKASLLTSYSDDYYHRVHVSPARLDFGNIASSQEVKIYVWNAHFNPKPLNAINGISEGLILEGQQPPATYQALEEKTYTLTVTPNGATVIDDKIGFDFDNEAPCVVVTGDRIVAFSLMPDWSEGVTERLEWSTDILTSASGMEQRSALYLFPRRFFETNFIFHQDERQYVNNMMSWGAKVWAIPLWPYVQFITTSVKAGSTSISCTTKNMEFTENGLAILWRDAFVYEIAEIVAIKTTGLTLKRPLQNEWPQGTRIYPARAAMFNKQPEFARKTDQLQTASIEFRLTENSPSDIVPPVTEYQGYPLLTLRPEETENLTSSYQRLLLTLDNGMALPKVTDTSGYSFYLQSYKWQGMGREERQQFRGLAYYLNGCQKALWIPSHADDLTIIDTIRASEAVLIIKPCGYSRFAKDDPDKKHIAIYLTTGEAFYRQITNCKGFDHQEQLAIDSPLGKEITPKQVAYVCFMRLCRSNSDTVEINHTTDSEGVASSQLTFRRVRDNELQNY